MSSENELREVKGSNEFSIVEIAIDGYIDSSSSSESSPICDKCADFELLPDPDPFDWFRDGDMKAVCHALNVVFLGGLEDSNEWTNICRPLFCPKLGRNLTDEEKIKAEKELKHAQLLTKIKSPKSKNN